MTTLASTRIDLTWTGEFQPILDKLNPQGMFPNINRTAYVLLSFLKDGVADLTAGDVISYIHEEMAPRNGWVAFDRQKWLDYVPAVIAQLQNELPRLLAEAKSGTPFFRTPQRH